MPILDIELVLRPGEAVSTSVMLELADRAAAVFGSGPRQTWVKLHLLEQYCYAENGTQEDEDLTWLFPVFVRVLKAQLPEGEQLEAELQALTATIAEALLRPVELVHVLYEPAGAGRVAFGGRLVK